MQSLKDEFDVDNFVLWVERANSLKEEVISFHLSLFK
jgi:hypothetical protein